MLFVLLFVCYASYAYNRKSVSFALPKLIDDGLDKSYAGLILTCMNGAFAVSESVAGTLSDLMPARVLLAFGLLLSGTATLLFSQCDSPLAFCVLWTVNGLAQGCGFSPCAKVVRRKFPASQFGTLFSVLSAANNVAGTLTPFLSTFFIINYGWRASLIAAGLLSVILGIVALLAIPNVESSDASEKPAKTSGKDEYSDAGVSKKDILLDPFLWLVALGPLVAYCAKSTVVDWGQLYLMEERDRSQQDASAFTSGVEGGGFLGRILAGFLADRLVARRFAAGFPSNASKPNTRMVITVVFLAGSVIMLHLLQNGVTEETPTLWISAIGFSLGVTLCGPLAVCGIAATESVPLHLAGTALSLSACAGSVGAMFSGLPISYLAKHTSWDTAFFALEVSIAVLVVGMVFCKNLHPRYAHVKKED